MSVQDQISNDIKEAMKARNVDKLAALRAVKSAIMLEATKEGNTTVSDEVSLQIIVKLVKQRKDSAAIFTEQNRPDLALMRLINWLTLKIICQLKWERRK